MVKLQSYYLLLSVQYNTFIIYYIEAIYSTFTFSFHLQRLVGKKFYLL